MMSFQPRLAPVLAGPETKDDSKSIRQKAERTNGFRSRLLSAMKCSEWKKGTTEKKHGFRARPERRLPGCLALKYDQDQVLIT